FPPPCEPRGTMIHEYPCNSWGVSRPEEVCMSCAEAYPARETGVVLVDPLNEFLAEEGKIWPEIKEVTLGVGALANMARLLAGARSGGLRVFYSPHRTDPWDYRDWRFLTNGQRRTFEQQRFQTGSWGAEFHPDLAPAAG